MKRKIIALMLACAVVLGCTGCVKVIKIGEEGKYTGKAAFNAADAAAGLWEEAVVNIQEKAVELPDFLEEANGDLASLVDKYGKYSMGTSGSISYAVKGTGVVEEVNQEKKAGYMTVKLDGYDGPEVIKIQIGSVYKGSSTRDTLDIVNFGNYKSAGVGSNFSGIAYSDRHKYYSAGKSCKSFRENNRICWNIYSGRQ